MYLNPVKSVNMELIKVEPLSVDPEIVLKEVEAITSNQHKVTFLEGFIKSEVSMKPKFKTSSRELEKLDHDSEKYFEEQQVHQELKNFSSGWHQTAETAPDSRNVRSSFGPQNAESEFLGQQQQRCSNYSNTRGKIFDEEYLNVRRIGHTHATSSNMFLCNFCRKGFSDKKNLKVHIEKHIKEKYPPKICCKICGTKFTRSDSFKRHMNLHNQKFLCKVCSKSFQSKYHLSIHLRIHTEEKPFSCDMCGSSFSRKEILVRHLRSHTDIYLYSCEYCGIGIDDKSNLQRHLMRHTGARPFSCEICNKSFSEKGNLQKHRMIHDDKKPRKKTHLCGTCGDGFYTNGTLKRHMETHLDEKNFVCKVCSKSFVREKDLKRHSTTHGAKKLFPCELCVKRFSRQDSMRAHLKKEHKIIKPTAEESFVCEFCGSRFTRKAELTKHTQKRWCQKLRRHEAVSDASIPGDKELLQISMGSRNVMPPKEEPLIDFETKIEDFEDYVKLEETQ